MQTLSSLPDLDFTVLKPGKRPADREGAGGASSGLPAGNSKRYKGAVYFWFALTYSSELTLVDSGKQKWHAMEFAVMQY